MLAATLRSCFGPCFKRFGSPSGYDSIEDISPEHLDSISSFRGRPGDNCYESLDSSPLYKAKLDHRSKSTSEIFRDRSSEYYWAGGGGTNFIKPDKRSFSASFGYLNENDLFESFSQGMRSTLTSANDMSRSDVSESFWSCRGSIRSSISKGSTYGETDFYSDESEDPHEEELVATPVCRGCGESGKEHRFDDLDKCNWRETSLEHSSFPKSQKWVQLD